MEETFTKEEIEQIEKEAAKNRELAEEERLLGTEEFLLRHPEVVKKREELKKTNPNVQFDKLPESYLYSRIYREYECVEKDFTVKLSFTNMSDGLGQIANRKIFTLAKDGGIDILVYDINGNVIEYAKQKQGQTEQLSDLPRMIEYKVHRNSPDKIAKYEKEHKGQKDADCPRYTFPKKEDTGDIGTFPFFPPKLLTKYKKKTEINTLILTEGYFKAFCASLHGADIVGLGSITLFEEKRNAQLYPDIIRLIRECKVKNIVILYDGDALDIKKSKLAEMKTYGNAVELTTRPKQFAHALDKLRGLIQKNFANVGIYFGMVNSENLNGKPKGLDDLLNHKNYKSRRKDILEELTDVSAPTIYFQKYNIKVNRSVDKYFYIDSVSHFYTKHAEEIGESRFKYMGTTYRFDNIQGYPVKVGTYDIDSVVRVDGNYYIETRIPSFKDLEGRITLKKIKRQDIIDDFGKDAPMTLVKRKYIAFVNIPSHTQYQQVIGNCWNKYNRLSYEPEQGDWIHIDMLLHHLFDASGHYELILDYLAIMYQKPEHALPIICLVSREGGTGKTTFLKLIEAMFEENVAVDLSDSELSAQFNTATSGKLAIGIDETAVGDNKRITEVLKRISTSDTTYTEAKGQDKVKEDSFTKIILCSNNETHFAHIRPEEQRFWVVKVPVLTEEQKEAYPNLKEYLKDEVPAFVAYLNSRGIKKERKTRLWFRWEDYHTPAFDRLIECQQPRNIRVIKDYITPIFFEKLIDEVKWDARFITEELGRRMDANVDVKKLLEEQLGLEKWNNGALYTKKLEMYHIKADGTIVEGNEPGIIYTPMDKYCRNCRPYIFSAKKILSDKEYRELQDKIERVRVDVY